jgi:hypothetical protein
MVAEARQCLAERKPQILTYQESDGLIELFVEVRARPPTLLIVGAGRGPAAGPIG